MTAETLISGLSQEDRRHALELLWAAIDRDADKTGPPSWHSEVLAERLNNPSKNPSGPLGEAMADVRRRVDDRRASS